MEDFPEFENITVHCPVCSTVMHLVGIEQQAPLVVYTYECEACGKLDTRAYRQPRRDRARGGALTAIPGQDHCVWLPDPSI